MPTYATQSDILKTISPEILGQLTDDEFDGQPNSDVIDELIDQAEGVVNAALSKAGYAVPVVTPIPAGAELVHAATVWLTV